MAVMNRFAPVTVSWKQTQPKVISECCFLTEGILFQQTSLLNTSFFPQPPTEQHQDLLCLFILPPPPSQHSFSPFCLAEASPLLWLHSKCLQCVVPQIHPLPRVTTLPWPRCIISFPVSNGKRLQYLRYWKASSVIVHDYLPIAGAPTKLPTNWRQKDKPFHAPHSSPSRLPPVFHHGSRAC